MLGTKQRRVSISHALEFALKGVFLAENSEAGGWSCVDRRVFSCSEPRVEFVDCGMRHLLAV
jgi:hypothetical protein